MLLTIGSRKYYILIEYVQIYAKYLYVCSRTWRKHTIRLCKRLHD